MYNAFSSIYSTVYHEYSDLPFCKPKDKDTRIYVLEKQLYKHNLV
jgi:hypothetical protein